jgi:predicted DNA-binding transcriptional regulator YafY
MRADRLVATLLVLQARGRVTAAELAGELEVSVATARRDLEALSTAGVPVYPQPGRGGGWSLVGGARTDLSGLTSAEARALFLLAGPAAAVAPPIRPALRKLVRALPDTFRADAEAAADAVVVDAARWGERDRDRPELVDLLQDAVVRRRKVAFRYASRGAAESQRLVDPLGLVDKDEVWYLVAGTEKGQRTFRVDRITGAEVTEQVAERMLPVLQDHFGRHCEPLEMLADGRVRVRVAAPMALSIAEKLAGWGAAVEVLEPEAVRAELARLGAELVARYGRA